MVISDSDVDDFLESESDSEVEIDWLKLLNLLKYKIKLEGSLMKKWMNCLKYENIVMW